MGELGAALIAPGVGVLTHCNTGSLATAGYGTALGVIRAGVAAERIARVFAGETRPWLQGARLTMWELRARRHPGATLIADSAAAHLMKTGDVQWVIVGADRIAANGDTANKIGTYQLAIAAQPSRREVHGGGAVLDGRHGHRQRRRRSRSSCASRPRCSASRGKRTVVEGAQAWNPVFDVTPAELIDAIVTERGVIERPDSIAMQAMFGW